MKDPIELKKHKRKQNIISAAILVGGTILSFIIFGPHKSKSQNDQADSPLSQQMTPANVSVMELGKDESRTAKLEKTATLEPEGNGVEIISEYSGRIQNVKFEVGDFVKKGQILAAFNQDNDQNSPKVALESAQKSLVLAQENLNKTKDIADKSKELAESAVKIAEIQLKQAKDGDDERLEDLAEENLEIAEDQEDQAKESVKLQINSAEIQLQQAQSAVDQARIGYEKTIIESPISGLVVSKNINKEAYINQGQTVAHIVGQGKLHAKVYLSENEIGRIKQGDEVEIHVNGSQHTGEIVSYSSIANGENGRFEVLIRTMENLSSEANKNAALIMNLSLEGNGSGKFFIPLNAVNIGQQKKTVFIAENGRAVSRDVETGIAIGTQIEIISGLTEGESVIVDNSKNLQDGQEVKIRE